MELPEIGAFQRKGISVDGGPMREDQRIIWLQVGPYYADSRGFAGTTSCVDDLVRWEHEVGTPGDDEGYLQRSGNLLIEEGTTPSGGMYVELWRVLPGPHEPAGAWSTGDGRVVRVGGHVVHVDGAGGLHLTI